MFARLLFSHRLHLFEGHLESKLEFRLERCCVVLVKRARFKQFAFIQLRRRRSLVDFRVKVGLGEGRLVAFVVPVPTITIHVDHDVPSKFLAEIERELTNEHDREWIVTIHMENRHLNHFGDVSGVHRRARVFGHRGKSDLIIHHDVNGAARAVAVQLRHVQSFGNYPLPRERGVAMNEQR